jgi:hypothetical protein
MDPRLVVPFRDLDAACVRAIDGCVGRLETALVDAERWTVRWLAVRLDCCDDPDRMTWVPVDVAERWDPTEQVVDVRCTMENVRRAPSWPVDTTLTRERETILRQWYGAAPSPPHVDVIECGTDPCLRTLDDLIGTTVTTPDGRHGSLVDVCVDTGAWTVASFEVDPSPWWPGDDHVLVEPQPIAQKQLPPPA